MRRGGDESNRENRVFYAGSDGPLGPWFKGVKGAEAYEAGGAAKRKKRGAGGVAGACLPRGGRQGCGHLWEPFIVTW